MDTEPSWKQVRLSLERPYKDDHGSRIPVVEDITPEGEYIYETKENPSARLGINLRRIFQERGPDFFDRISESTFLPDGPRSQDDAFSAADVAMDGTDGKDEEEPKLMTAEDLQEMREEILKNLAISLGEMTLAQQVLVALLISPTTEAQSQSQSQPKTQNQTQTQSLSQPQSQPSSQSQPGSLTTGINFSATLVTKPPPITSLRAFNSQLTIGGKDEALRRAASLFKVSAESMERTRLAGEKYWVDALKIRRNNWGLVPAPLPPGSATGKGADKTSKDFLVSYGLEESPAQFRRRAIGRLPTYTGESFDMVFPHRRMTRLCASITTRNEAGATRTTSNTIPKDNDKNLHGALRAAQREIVEQEIFSILVREAGSLPTASARVSERLIVIDAAQGLELQIELVDSPSQDEIRVGERSDMCDLIYYGFHILLLRRHAQLKVERLNSAGSSTMPLATQVPALPDNQPNSKHPILQPIIDLLQYRVFLDRIQKEIKQVFQAMQTAGIPATLVVNSVGETGKELIRLLDPGSSLTVGGEIVLRIYDRHTIRLTFVSPSTLVAHLSQSTLTISSVPQLCHLLMDEVEQCLLKRICDLGKCLSDGVGGTWFIDLDRCVGRWEGCVLNFRITYGPDYSIHCTAYFLGRSTGKQGQSHQYPPRNYKEAKFLEWAEYLIKNAINQADIDF